MSWQRFKLFLIREKLKSAYLGKMVSYFTTLFDYDRYTNSLILETAAKTADFENAIKLIAHIIAAQQIWLNRCKALPPPVIALWPNLFAEKLTQMADQNNAEWLSYLGSLTNDDFDQMISYKNQKGDAFESKLANIITHVINHGTHHRAQAGQQLKAAGIEPLPNTDFIFYIRTK